MSSSSLPIDKRKISPVCFYVSCAAPTVNCFPVLKLQHWESKQISIHTKTVSCVRPTFSQCLAVHLADIQELVSLLQELHLTNSLNFSSSHLSEWFALGFYLVCLSFCKSKGETFSVVFSFLKGFICNTRVIQQWFQTWQHSLERAWTADLHVSGVLVDELFQATEFLFSQFVRSYVFLSFSDSSCSYFWTQGYPRWQNTPSFCVCVKEKETQKTKIQNIQLEHVL